jgi:NAD(P)-dependent dehydrogenase (short-subunit alcohol dehydrogenase family)
MSAPFLIVGAGGGTGKALAQHLLDAGQEVFLTARHQADLDAFDAPGAELDVLDADAVTEVVDQVAGEDGLAGLAYCVGSIVLKPLKGAKDKDFLDTFELNVMGAVRVLRAAEKALKKGKGSVVLFSTVAVQHGFNNHSVIASAKGAIEGLTRSLAAEWAPAVRVNAIAPSLSDTKMAQPMLNSERMKEGLAKAHPLQRIGTGEDLAAATAWLLSEQSSWITGQVIGVDGGRSSLNARG